MKAAIKNYNLKSVLFTAFAMLYTLFIFAQQNVTQSQNVHILSEYIGKSVGDRTSTINSLQNGDHPSVYAFNGKVSVMSKEKPVVAYMSLEDMNLVSERTELFTEIKMLTVIVEQGEFNDVLLNLDKMNSLKSLEYLIVRCHYDCSVDLSSVSNRKSDANYGFTVLFDVVIPE